jgi:V8-like Glu-specific endopeptidase
MKPIYLLSLVFSLLCSHVVYASNPYEVIERAYGNQPIFSPGTVKYEAFPGTTILYTRCEHSQEPYKQKVLVCEKEKGEVRARAKESVLKKVIQGTDGRTEVQRTTDWPYRAVVQLESFFKEPSNNDPNNLCKYIGTGCFVGPQHVLTCGHNVYNEGVWADQIKAIPAKHRQTAPFGRARVVRSYTYKKWSEGENDEYDIALLVLDEALGRYTGWFGLIGFDDISILQRIFNLTGFAGDKKFRMHTMAHTIKKSSPKIIWYEHDTSGGQSGSPVWLDMKGTGSVTVPMIGGVHTVGEDDENHGTRLLQSMIVDLIVPKISETYTINKPLLAPLVPSLSMNNLTSAFANMGLGASPAVVPPASSSGYSPYLPQPYNYQQTLQQLYQQQQLQQLQQLQQQLQYQQQQQLQLQYQQQLQQQLQYQQPQQPQQQLLQYQQPQQQPQYQQQPQQQLQYQQPQQQHQYQQQPQQQLQYQQQPQQQPRAVLPDTAFLLGTLQKVGQPQQQQPQQSRAALPDGNAFLQRTEQQVGQPQQLASSSVTPPLQAWQKKIGESLYITELDLEGRAIGAGLQDLKQLKALTKLNLLGSSISKAEVQFISENLTTLTELNLSYNNIGNEGARQLAQGELTALKSLHLMNCEITHPGVESISNGKLSNLTFLDLSKNTKLASLGTGHLTQGGSLLKLNHLSLHRCNVCLLGAQYLGEAKNLPSLTYLDLSENKLNDEACEAIQKGNFSALRELNLLENNIGDVGARWLANGGTFQGLTKLVLLLNNVGDQGAYALVESVVLTKKLSKLEELDLRCQQVSKEDATSTISDIGQARASGLLQGFPLKVHWY